MRTWLGFLGDLKGNRFQSIPFQHEVLDFATKIPSIANLPFFSFIKKGEVFFWNVFCERLAEEPLSSQEKVSKIFRKYGIYPFKSPLEKKQIHLALAALHTPYVADLGENPSKLPPEEVSSKIDDLLETVPPLPDLKTPKGEWKKIYEMVYQDAHTREVERCWFLKRLSSCQTPFEYWEHLTKQVSGRDLEEGMIIPAFKGEEFYYIYKKICQGGMIAYALKPLYGKSSLTPVLFFRPTQVAIKAENMLATLMDNLSSHGVGYTGFYAGVSDLEALVKDPSFKKESDPLIVAGYSLGGGYAQRFMAHKDLWKHCSQGYIFNAPAIDYRTASRFAFKINSGAHALPFTPSLFIFRTQGDPVDQGGEIHLGRGVLPNANINMQLIEVIPNPTDSLLERHFGCYLGKDAELRFFDLKDPQNQALLSNIQRDGRKSKWEEFRRWMGRILRPAYRIFLLFYSLREYFLARDSKEI